MTERTDQPDEIFEAPISICEQEATEETSRELSDDVMQ